MKQKEQRLNKITQKASLILIRIRREYQRVYTIHSQSRDPKFYAQNSGAPK